MQVKNIQPSFGPPLKGSVLISEPYLSDLQFRRTVVLLGEHNEDGSVGFVLNRLLSIRSNEVVPGLLDIDFPLFYGGPVEPNTLHFIHTVGELIEGAQPIKDGIFWGGNIELVNDLLNQKVVKLNEFKFFVGYSGWAPGQLEDEMQEKAWWLGEAPASLIFSDDPERMWTNVVKNLNEDYAYMANSPDDPQWN
ncbi:MAG: YqgE/AlgH family protein [Bacteroidota bacterium]|jgi:putative transcriptional regulator|nr:YqgE/AlgH family protein [Sphingobacteriales bacterium]